MNKALTILALLLTGCGTPALLIPAEHPFMVKTWATQDEDHEADVYVCFTAAVDENTIHDHSLYVLDDLHRRVAGEYAVDGQEVRWWTDGGLDDGEFYRVIVTRDVYSTDGRRLVVGRQNERAAHFDFRTEPAGDGRKTRLVRL